MKNEICGKITTSEKIRIKMYKNIFQIVGKLTISKIVLYLRFPIAQYFLLPGRNNKSYYYFN